MNKIYAGIGARKTPTKILQHMEQISSVLSANNYMLRSGAADGADAAFERGAKHKHIFLPWGGFNNSKSTFTDPTAKAMNIAENIHPYWGNLRQGARKMMARNVHQILGLNCDSPVDFVICWTPSGRIVGGTGFAINLADKYNIPVFNLGDLSRADVMNEIQEMEGEYNDCN
jgi:hypothetical protein